MRRGLLCPCAEMTHGVPSRHARAQRTDTHKEGKIHGARSPPPATPRAAAAGPSARAPHSPDLRSPAPHVAPNSARTRSAKYRTRVPGKCGADQAGCAAAAARGTRPGERLQHPCRVGAGAGEGTRRGAAPSAPGRRSAHPRAGPRRRASTRRPRARRAHCAAHPFVPLGTRRLHGVPGSTRAARGRGGTRSGMVRAAAAARPTRAARRPRTPARRRDGAAGAAGRLCGARGGSALAHGRAAAGDGSA